jgi:hypothetical protein
MKKAIIITSAIDVNNNHPLTYSSVRSHFGNEERFRQTVATLASWDQAGDSETTLFLLDISENYAVYRSLLSYQKNLVYVSVKELIPEIFETVTTHANKSYCEQLLIYSFLTKFRKDLEPYDYFFKFSGRYLIDSHFSIEFFDHVDHGGLFFKAPLKFEWNENWPYAMVDRRQLQGDNKLYQYCSVLYGWSRAYHDQMIDIYRVISEFCSNPSSISYDVETLLYYFTRQFELDIVEMPWIVYGWDGTSGNFLRY